MVNVEAVWSLPALDGKVKPETQRLGYLGMMQGVQTLVFRLAGSCVGCGLADRYPAH